MHHKHHDWHVQMHLSNVWRIIILISLQSRKTFDEVYTETVFQNRWDLRGFYCCFYKEECQSCECGLEQNFRRSRFGTWRNVEDLVFALGDRWEPFITWSERAGWFISKYTFEIYHDERLTLSLPRYIFIYCGCKFFKEWSEEELKLTRKCPFWEVHSILGCIKRWNNSNFV